MIAVVQRVTSAKVEVEGGIVGQIGEGMLVLLAVEREDTSEQAKWMAQKLATLRIFRNGDKYFDADVAQIGGSILLVSNFTVAAETRQGRRPSLSGAADPEKGKELFDEVVAAVSALGIRTETGQFRASMLVSLTNDGPVTFIVDSKAK
jgi:D-tyrosyl-tRNA(Tyr) deacylase